MTNLPTNEFNPCPRERAARHIAELFTVLHVPEKGEAEKILVKNFLDAVELVPEWAIADASRCFRFGTKGNGKFIPTPAEFAMTAREIADKERQRLKSQQQISDQFAEEKRRKEFLENRENQGGEAFKKALAQWRSAYTKHKVEMKEADEEYQRQQADKLNIRKDKRPLSEITHERYADQGRANLEALIAQQEDA